MADNLNITSGSGVVVKTDEIGGFHYQQIKLVDGNLDSTNPTGVINNPLIINVLNTRTSVTISGGITLLSSSAVTVSGSVTSLVSGGVTLLSSGYLDVNVFSNTGGTVTVLNTRSLSTVSGTVTSVITGGVTLLSSVPLSLTGTVTISGGVTLLSSSSVTVTGTVTAVASGTQTISGGVTILSSSAVTVSGTVTSIVSGGVTLVSSTILVVRQGSTAYTALGFTPTWIYAMLPSNNMTVVWTPAATKRFNITDITLSNKSASSITVTQDSAATVTLMKLELYDRGGWVSNFQTPIIASQTNHALVVQTSVTGTNSWILVNGYESA
jgi:hypothetical protein